MELINNSSQNSKRIYLLGRHGKASHNRYDDKAVFAGQRVDNELTEEGIFESKQLGLEILDNSGCDVVVCSHMKRSKQTAKVIADEIKIKTNIDIPIIEIDNLEEIDVGEFTGLTKEEAIEKYGEAANVYYDGRVKDFNFPNGEDYKKLKSRVSYVLDQLQKIEKTYSKILIIGHGMFNKVIIHEILHNREDIWRVRHFEHDKIIMFTEDELINFRRKV